MRLPAPPPDLSKIIEALGDGSRFTELATGPYVSAVGSAPYRPWDQVRNRRPPEGLSHEEWWLVTKLARAGMRRHLPLTDRDGRPFTYALPDEALEALDEVSPQLAGRIGTAEQVTNPATRNRYVVNSLMEEAITSSQLEGAATTRAAAREMIRNGRQPRNRDERMVFNNYLAMRSIGESPTSRITGEEMLDLHRIVTQGTLDRPDSAGRFQAPGDERVGVWYDDVRVHQPPPAELLPSRTQRLCDFANGDIGDTYVPGVIRAIVTHFMIGYDHPFEDGNGRTARALFYWVMLREGYWLTEFISISRILKNAQSQYARSFLYSEQDDNDLTYFILNQLKVIRRAIRDLNDYLERQVREAQEFERTLAAVPGEFNHRQIAILQNALRHPGRRYTVPSHGTSHSISRQTARNDLKGLESKGLLHRHHVGKGFAWIPAKDLLQKLRS